MKRKKYARLYPWRTVEAIAHRLASTQPNAEWSIWLENFETEYSQQLTIKSSTRAALAERSLRDLRQAKGIIDGGEDFDGCDVYTFEVIDGGGER